MATPTDPVVDASQPTPDLSRPPTVRRRGGWSRGETSIGSMGWTLAAIVTIALAGCGYWATRAQSRTLEAARRDQLVAAAQVLAQAAEPMLALEEVSTVRRLVMDTAERFQIDRLRIVLASGDVIADRDPRLITADPRSAIWQPAGESAAPRVESGGGTLNIRHPLAVEGRGGAVLEMTASLSGGREAMWEMQAGVGAISVASLAALLLAYRQFRSRFAAMSVIRQSLLALEGGEQSESALSVAEGLGREARTWNAVLEERKRQRRAAAVRQVKQGMDDRRGSHGALSTGCDAMSQGVLLLDDRLQVTYANNAAAIFLGAQRDTLIGTPLAGHVRDAELARVVADAVTHRKRAAYVHDRRAAGDAGVIRYTLRPVRETDGASALLVIEDVTQQRVAEEARHEFVAQATHELRTPLTNIRLYLETAIDDGDKDPALRAKCLNIINQETLRLERMVGDMLQVAEIESGTLQVKRDDVHVGRLLQDIEAEYTAQAVQKDLALQFNLPPKLPVLQGDRDKLIMAVQNLVGNALKYTPDGGRITVTAEVKDNELRIDVADSGIGISSDDQARVFDKFYRAKDKRISGITGSGLGLALARQIARLHGGDITLDSQVDHGSTFTLSLPVPPHAETTQTE